jgi:hypothetical protein
MRMILWPALVTLAVTLLRLTGELQGWSKALFNPAAGGGGALVGISWLPILFGPYFAWRLAREGKSPQSAWKVAGLALLGYAITIAAFAGVQALKPGAAGILAAFLLALALAFLPWKAWPELAKTQFAYALAARIPVVVVMLLAIYGNWGTHYDVLPPDPPPDLVAAGPLGRWFMIGLIPQLTLWIGHTVLLGSLVGAVVVGAGQAQARDRLRGETPGP